MRKTTSSIRYLPLLTAFAAALLLAGCGGGIDFEGPGFEALGLTSKKQKGDKKVPDRAPLLIPPDRARLPAPLASSATPAAAPQNWPTDPELVLKAEANVAEQKNKDYIDKGDWSKNANVEEFENLMGREMSRNSGVFGDRELSKKYRGGEEKDPVH